MIVSILLVMVSSLCAGEEPSVTNFFVSTTGNDTNPGTKDAPFATVGRAQQAVRSLVAKGLDWPVIVHIRNGTYRLDSPLAFGHEDSGTSDYRITYAAYPGETPVLTGGRVITGWEEAGDGKWTAKLPEVMAGKWTFRQLFADGQRLPRGRFRNEPDLLRVESVSDDVTGIVLDQSPSAANLAGKNAELVMYQNWSISRVAIMSLDDRSIQLANPMGWIGHGPATTASPHKPTFIEHALEFVDQPGEWYLDHATGVLTYQAAKDENPNDREFVAPVLDKLLLVEGRPDAPVQNLHLAGLTFQHTRWELPAFGY